MWIKRSQLQQSRSRYFVSHSARKPGLCSPILISEQSTNQHQISVSGTKHPLAIISNINMCNWRAKPRKSSLRLPHRCLWIQPYFSIKRPNNNGTIGGSITSTIKEQTPAIPITGTGPEAAALPLPATRTCMFRLWTGFTSFGKIAWYPYWRVAKKCIPTPWWP